MAVITISRGSYSYGKDVAERVARKLNYECISREVLLSASKQFDIPEIRLLHAIKDAPSFLERFTHGKAKYVAYIRASLLRYVMKDNLVYHGFAGHFLLEGVPQVLKVRVCASIEERKKLIMQRENVSEKEASRILKDIDGERKKWAMRFYGKDPCDLSMYDLGLVIDTLTVEDAVDNIVSMARRPCFQRTPASQKIIADLALAAQIKSSLMDHYPDAEVSVEDGIARVHIRGTVTQEQVLRKDIEETAMGTSGIKEVRVDIHPFY